MHLHAGEGLDVREHQFLAATDHVEFSCATVKGFNLFWGGSGMIIDQFYCRNDEGVLWLHGYGNVFEEELGPGKQIDIEPGGWVCKNHSGRWRPTSHH